MTRPVRVVTTGGTIAMAGGRAVPVTDPTWMGQVLGVIAVETFANKPSVHLSAAEALALATRVSDLARTGQGVVVTHGTDLLEQTAFLTDLVLDADAPVVFTGSMRPADAPGSDGAANLADAVAAAAADATAGAGALVAFAGELHQARFVRKSDSVGPAAFSSPLAGPIGYVREGRVSLIGAVIRSEALPVRDLDACVEIVSCALGSDGRLLLAAAKWAEGLVVVLPGAGHVPPPFLNALREVAADRPVVACVHPSRGALLRETYGFLGAEADVRAAGVIGAARLSPVAARIKLMAVLGAGLDRAAIAEAFRADDW